MISRSKSALAQSVNESVIGTKREMRPVLVRLNGNRDVAVLYNLDRDDGENASSCGSESDLDDTMADPDYIPDPTDSSGEECRGAENIFESTGQKRKAEAAVPRGGKGRVKVKIELIKNRPRRHATFSKRRIGLMKKVHELATLTGCQVLALVVSETGHVYTNATRKLQPILTGEEGRALIQSCLDSPDPPSHYDPSADERMSTRGFEESGVTFRVSSESPAGHTEAAGLVGPASSAQSAVPTAPTSMQLSRALSFPITIPPSGFMLF